MSSRRAPHHAEPGSRTATLTSEWLINHIREHGSALTVVRDLVVD
jgi:hypothetical protein